MKAWRALWTTGAIVVCGALVGFGWTAGGRAQTVNAQAAHAAITGAWTLNTDLSDKPPEPSSGSDRASGGRRPGGMGRGRGGMGGGMGRGGMGGGGGNGAARMDPEEMTRLRDAVHDIMTAPSHLTITQTDAMVLVTSEDGRTTRLAPDGSKVKDDNTKIERKTKWDGPRLVSEINGLPTGKVTESYAIDDEHHQLHVIVQTEEKHDRKAMTMNRIYDADSR
jgi:hypothetical protein